ncbi:unnamed protein product, partial [Ectocarpus sp. 12 AP-2014]
AVLVARASNSCTPPSMNSVLRCKVRSYLFKEVPSPVWRQQSSRQLLDDDGPTAMYPVQAIPRRSLLPAAPAAAVLRERYLREVLRYPASLSAETVEPHDPSARDTPGTTGQTGDTRARVTCVRRFVAKAAREQERTKIHSGGHNKLAEIVKGNDKIATPLAVKRCEQVLDADSEHKLDIFHVGRKCAMIPFYYRQDTT